MSDVQLAEIAANSSKALAEIAASQQSAQALVDANKELERTKSRSQTVIGVISGLIVALAIGGSVWLASIGEDVPAIISSIGSMLAGGLNLILGIKIGNESHHKK